jgi:sulfatase modifying factor 1
MHRRASLVSLLTLTCHIASAPGLEPAAPANAVTAPRSGSAAILTAPALPAATPTPGAHASPPRGPDPATNGRCPREMALIERPDGPFCIDRWEASLQRNARGSDPWPSNEPVDGVEAEVVAVSQPGVKPQGYISGAQASRACQNANKRLCTLDEWLHACRGPRQTTYPYGNERRSEACNDRTMNPPEHPVVRLFNQFAKPDTDRATMWHLDWMNDPRLHELPDTVASTGGHGECRNEYGVYDLVGNLHEWISDPEGTFVGGFFMDTIRNGEGCSYKTTAHDARYHDYSTGFRCCQ